MASSDFILNTDNNIQKAYINVQETYTVPGSYSYNDYTIDHNLGYIPSARVWYKPVAGRWYPLALNQMSEDTSDFLEYTGAFSLSTTQLTISLVNLSGSDADIDIQARIYIDG